MRLLSTLVSLAALLASGVSGPALLAQDPQESSADAASPAVEQLRHVVGIWDVTTTFIAPDGTEAVSFDGTYDFDWVVQDRIVRGISSIPELQMSSGILFYLRPSTNEIEMVSVGPDGQLWTMTGPQDSETRSTPIVQMPDGSTLKLRFTRFNVTPDRFESRMERSTDGGETWTLGNRQVFLRRSREN